MSIIAIKGVPVKWTLAEIVKKCSKVINGQFEPLNFLPEKFNAKVCYIRLSERLDPVRVVENLNKRPMKGVKLVAFIPEHVPDLPLARKKGKLFKRNLRTFKLMRPHEIALIGHLEILTEMQYKYAGLYNLSNKTGHKLLEEVARKVYERLKVIMETNKEVHENSFLLTQVYRKAHPHFGDFQLILDTLHALQDASGAPRMQVIEKDLMQYSPQGLDKNQLPLGTIHKYCNIFSNDMMNAIKQHIEKLDTQTNSMDTEETNARKSIREEIKKMIPYLPLMLNQIAKKHFVQTEAPHARVRIYGEPFLPAKNVMLPIVIRYNPDKNRVQRSNRMFNMLKFNLPQNKFTELIAMDGTIINGAKLIIRGDLPVYKPSKELKREMLLHFGGDATYEIPDEEEDEEEDNGEKDEY